MRCLLLLFILAVACAPPPETSDPTARVSPTWCEPALVVPCHDDPQEECCMSQDIYIAMPGIGVGSRSEYPAVKVECVPEPLNLDLQVLCGRLGVDFLWVPVRP